ncbi:MAG: RNA polymerase sigma factor [Anaerolineae bacterium]|nr:RNA polymerase sigma factor [Anaerolineae bacterium]
MNQITPTHEVMLAQRLAQGDPDAVELLVAEYTDDLYRFVYNQVGGSQQDAEDVVQETLVAALRAIRRFRGDSKLRTWLFSIAAHKVADRRRRIKRQPQQIPIQEVLFPLVAEDALPEQFLDKLEVRQAVRTALMQLPLHYRMALILKYVEELSVREIASVMDRSEKSIESILVRARRLLAQMFEEKHDRA